jgi:hypothetical protein
VHEKPDFLSLAFDPEESKFPITENVYREESGLGVNYFRIARDTSALGNGKQRKARSADREPHDYCGRPVLWRMALWRGSGL